MIFLKIFHGIILFFLGVATLKYRKNIYEFTGRFDWAEKYLGSGGTVVVITIVGLILIFASIAYPAGIIQVSTNGDGFVSRNGTEIQK